MVGIDCVIVGGGAGGLTAATYLARFHRSVVVIDAGESRLELIPLSRNIPGFANGVSGKDLRARLITQATAFGAVLLNGRVTACVRDEEGFDVRSTGGDFHARTLILATGVDVTPPAMADLGEAIARGLIRYCPVCDGFEASHSRIGVLGGREGSIEEAHFLLTFSRDVTYLSVIGGVRPTHAQIRRALRAGIRIEPRACRELRISDARIAAVYEDGEACVFNTIYPCLGSKPRSELGTSLGAVVSTDGELVVDAHQATNVPGLYAVGDVLLGLDQVASACGQAAIAATAIHNRLRGADLVGA